MDELVGPRPDPLSFGIVDYPAGTVFPTGSAPWGKLLYAVAGVIEFFIAGRRILSPPAYAVWIPPNVEHVSETCQNVRYASIMVAATLCQDLPKAACTLALSPLFKAIMTDFSDRGITLPITDADRRQSVVLLDQMRAAPRYDSFLPSTDDLLLGPLLGQINACPGDRRSLAELARAVHTTERTLARRARQCLGMPFNEWRRRLKFVTAVSMLKDGHSVRTVARDLGYASPSAFIAMFRQLSGTSPAARTRKTISNA